MLKAEIYSYTPLASTNSIRLLMLQPGQPGSDVHCSLIHTTLPECHDDIDKQYTALSYVWGDARKTKTVFVNEKPFQATVNLATALDDIRHSEEVIRLWADAICIDQSNVMERNHQVGLMRDIYSLAQHTIIYLGDCNDHGSKDGMNAVLRGRLDYRLRQITGSYVLSRPWFTRVWIHQELVLSKEPWIQCGRQRIQWDAFYNKIMDREFTRDAEKGLENSNFKTFHEMHVARKRKPERPSLLEVLLSRRGFGASDPRDLVYGHLAVTRPSECIFGSGLDVDYRRSVVDVFTKATSGMAMDAANFEILLYNDVRDPQRRIRGLPSWVPDWSLPSSECLTPPLPPPVPTSYSVSEDTLNLLDCPKFSDITLCFLECLKIESVRSNIFGNANDILETVDMYDTLLYLEKLDGTLDRFYMSTTSQYRKIYEKVRALYGEDVLGPLPQQDDELSRDPEYRSIMDDTWEKRHLMPGCVSMKAVMMKNVLDPDRRAWTAGRKFVRLSGGALAIVSPATLPGDEIYAFAMRRDTTVTRPHEALDTECGLYLLVLRPYPNAPEAEPDRLREAKHEKHFVMVGVAWVGSECVALSEVLELLANPEKYDYSTKEAPEKIRKTTRIIIH